MHRAATQLINNYEDAVARIILFSIGESPISFGIRKTIGILKGSKSSFVIEHKLHELSMYGVLSNFKRNELRYVIELLIEKNLVQIEMVSEYENLPTLKITQKGREFITDKYQTDIRFLEKFTDRTIIELNEVEKELFNILKTLRRQISIEKDLPAFMICNDTIVRKMAKGRPTTQESLFAISGIGEKFIENYGDQFIGAIQAFIVGTHSGIDSPNKGLHSDAAEPA